MTEKRSNITSIKITGFGGQGIILAGQIIGEAAAIFDKKQSTFTQSYGPEARGGAACAEVIISDTRIGYPFVNQPDILVALSQTAYDKYISSLKEGGILITESELVNPHSVPKDVKMFSVPATTLAEKLGNKIVTNVVLLGYFAAVTELISKEAALKVLETNVPPRFIELNKKAFEV
ncbi:MAG: 2-oxoacid:acceptor oxidoreductase family protein, partial [Planctomycetota bacterium]